MSRLSPFRFLLPMVALALIGCGGAATPTRVPTPTSIILPTLASVVVPSDTPLPTPTLAPTTSPAPAASATPTRRTTPTRTLTLAPGTMRVKLFFVALEDNGKSGKKIGCNDSIVAVERIIPATQAPLTAALKELLSVRARYYDQTGLYNSLYESNLKVDGISIVGGKALIHLSGKVILGGVCDNPRVEAQIKETALQFATVKQVAVFVNGVPLEKILSQKGD